MRHSAGNQDVSAMDRHADTAALLADVWANPAELLRELPTVLRPRNEAQAYLVQRAVSKHLGAVGGWKVGSPGPEGPCNCAPLPAAGIASSPARLPASRYTLRGVEAEIAFRLGADLPARDAPYHREDIVAAIASCHPAIEVLQSRFTTPDTLDPWTLLADGLSHGGFVFGAPVPDWQAIDFAAEEVALTIDGTEVKRRTANPAGDMIRLVQWLADTGSRWAGGLRAGQFVTCGSWTGKDYAPPGGQVRVAFAHAGEAALEFVA